MKSLSIILVLVLTSMGTAYGACQRIQSDTTRWIGPASIDVTTSTNNGIEAVYCGPLLWDEYVTTLAVYMIWDDTLVNFDSTEGNIRAKDAIELKADAGELVIERIYAEQEFRSITLIGFPMPRKVFALMEETYMSILLPSARKNIDEQDTPIWWGLKELRNNRNTLLAGLNAWLVDPAKTADDVLGFDVEGWSGWGVARP